MAKSNDGVTIKVHKSYYEKIFEPERRRLQNKFGLSNFSQMKFTEYLSKAPPSSGRIDLSMFKGKKRGLGI